MHHAPAKLALAISLLLATACGASHKPAESPDFTEKGWSGSSADGAQAKADPSIQPASSKSDDAPKPLPVDKPMTATADKPETSSGTEADVVSGAALPPPPKAAKPGKAKKTPKVRKKTARNG